MCAAVARFKSGKHSSKDEVELSTERSIRLETGEY